MVRLIVRRPDGSYFTYVVKDSVFPVGSQIVGFEADTPCCLAEQTAPATSSRPISVALYTGKETSAEHFQSLDKVLEEVEPSKPVQEKSELEAWVLVDADGKLVPCTAQENGHETVIACSSFATAKALADYQKVFDIECRPVRVS